MQTFTKFIDNEKEMLKLGAALGQSIDNGAAIFLYGDLGAGKTTLTRGLLGHFGHLGKVKSPTYTIVEPYELKDQIIFHFDLYRLENAKELLQLGIEEYFISGAICLIEWPEKGMPLLPAADVTCYISFVNEGREVRMEADTLLGARIIQRMSHFI